MSLKALPVPPIPEETARVARAALPGGTLCVPLRDRRETRCTAAHCAERFPARGQPAEAPWRRALGCSSSRGCRIGQPLTPSAAGWTGRRLSAWS
jgi:hypothetical protein